MKNIYRGILFLLTALIVIGGILLFVMRSQALDVFSVQTDFDHLMNLNKIGSSPVNKSALNKDALNLKVLKSPIFASLRENVINFNFDNICQRSKSSVRIITGNEEPLSSQTPLCVQGNSDPFFIKNKN